MINLEKVHEVLDFIDETINLFSINDEVIRATKKFLYREKKEELQPEDIISPRYFFKNGGCAEFHAILKANFPESKMYATDGLGHILTEIDGILYDVNGIAEEWYEQDQYVEISDPLVQNFCLSYSFSFTAGNWFRPCGPTGVNMFDYFDSLNQEEIHELFSKLDFYGCQELEESYSMYLSGQIDECLEEELEGMITLVL